MKYYVGITDERWFRYLAAQKPDEINFWRPVAKTRFQAIPAGAPFLFKLHKPEHRIVGGGFFVGYISIPLTTAWSTFEQKNGAPNFTAMFNSIDSYRKPRGLTTVDPQIGCIILNQPFFFDRQDWIPVPADWADNIVQGKSYNSDEEPGRELWDRVATLLNRHSHDSTLSMVRETEHPYGTVFGAEYLRRARLGQGAFRAMITQAYNKTCCITGETTLPVLQAAHIQPVSREGGHELRNGILLRADMHILFDQGLISVSPEYTIKISSRIRAEYLNGRNYYVHDGHPLRSLPNDRNLRPDTALLAWHASEVFMP